MMKPSWSRVAGAYEQCLRAVWPERDYLPPALPGFLAEMTARLSARYYDREEALFFDVRETYSEVHKRLGLEVATPGDLYGHKLMKNHPYYLDTYSGRRRPTPFEATTETVRRLRDMRSLESALRPSTLAALLGGSASYGRFFNVKGGDDASDLDILLVVRDWAAAETAFSTIDQLAIVDSNGVDAAQSRIKDLIAFAEDRANIAFSAKVSLWANQEDPLLDGCSVTSKYLASFHVVTKEAFDLLVLHRAAEILTAEIGTEHTFLDYRDSAPSRGDMQRAFNGRALKVPIENEPHRQSFVRKTLTFRIDQDDCYYPGMFQNLILPAFDVRWGTTEIRRSIESFRWKMIDRLRMEQRLRPDEYMRLSLAHTRSEVFAPHTVRNIDSSTALA